MKLDFESIISNLKQKATDLSGDNGKIAVLLRKTKKTMEGNKELRSIIDDLKVMVDFVKDHYNGSYKNLTNTSIIIVLVGLLYLVNPMDLIPDFIFGGFLDDAAVIAYIFKRLTTEIDAYKLWKSERRKTDDDIIDLDDVIEMEDIEFDKDVHNDDMIDITPEKSWS